MMTCLSEALSFVMAALLILWIAATPHPAPQPGNECRVYATGLYLPCSKVGPTEAKFRDVWLSEGQDI
ncbi:hypothetical protein NKH91_06030 [Mesorhizobium sp. M0894]|uniref:hypothetical protein n=2 Tax=unclassified Mesorhizobium TaxID=325217 RepID=UPI0033373B60